MKRLAATAAVVLLAAAGCWYGYPRLRSRVKAVLSAFVLEMLDAYSHDTELARQRRALAESVEFVEAHLLAAPLFRDPGSLLEHAVRTAAQGPLSRGLYCEFGVYRGHTINHIASLVPHTVHGFDSFEGLPEDWRPGFAKGYFKLAQLPAVRSNVVLHKGWFDQVLPGFVRDHPQPVAFLHVDSDLYSSAKTVLEALKNQIRAGAVILFDEYYNYPGWRDGEFKAFQEFVAAHRVRFEYIGYNARHEQVAVKILAPAATP